MIKAKELRIGNLVEEEVLGMVRIISILSDVVCVACKNMKTDRSIEDLDYSLNLKSVKPIPLTPEILERCGLSKTLGELSIGGVPCAQFNFPSEFFSILTQDAKDRNLFHLNFHYVCDESNEEQNLKSVKYLHELQNLTYALTGQELSIKEPSKTIPA